MERTEGFTDRDRIVLRTDGEAVGIFSLPIVVGEIESVLFVDSDIPDGLLCFEAPVTKAWLKMYPLDEPPKTAGEVKWMLRAGSAVFHRPAWYRLEDKLYLYPPAPCDGRVILDYIEREEE